MIKDAPGTDTSVDKLLGCLLGGAVGDALGWPVEFMTLEEIRKKYGPEGICDFSEALGGVGAITDDTQMTLFTAEGLLREFRRSKETLQKLFIRPRGKDGAVVRNWKDIT